MKTYTYIPTADVFRAKSKKSIATYLKNNTRGFENDTMKDFMKGYSDRSALLGRSIRFDKEENFINDLFKNGDIIEGNAVEKIRSSFGRKKKASSSLEKGIGGRRSIEKKVDTIKLNRKIDELADKRDEEMFKNMTNEQKKYWLKILSERRDKGKNEGRLPKTYKG